MNPQVYLLKIFHEFIHILMFVFFEYGYLYYF